MLGVPAKDLTLANKNCAAGTWPWGNLTLAAGIDAMLQAHGLWGTLAAGIHACW